MKIIQLEDPQTLSEAVSALQRGEIVIFPSETCYGVAVDASNSEAVTKLLDYKKRPEGKAISIAVSDKKMAEEYITLNNTAANLYEQFLPGAITVISNSKGKADKRLESEAGTLGVRIPNYKFLLELTAKLGGAITATSANSAGAKTPYTVEDITNNISEKQKNLVSLIVDAGELPHNPPTTVIDTTREELTVYRQGRIDPQHISNYKELNSNSVEETIALGKNFVEESGRLSARYLLILLNGELGAGKTQFTKGIAQALGIDRIVKSPTYNYVNEYKIGNSTMYHMDAWRIQSKEDLDLLKFESWFTPGNVIVVEWPSVIMNFDKEFFDKTNYFYVDFIIGDNDSRTIKLFEVNDNA